MDWLAWMPYLVASIVGAVLLFLFLNWFRVKKMPPTDEAIVGEYRILIDIGTHIVSFEGTLYYFTKLLNPKQLVSYQKALEKHTEKKLEITELKKFLEEKAHCYAMRIGRQKFAFISVPSSKEGKGHPIEITPYFKTIEGSTTKLVLGAGSIGERRDTGFRHVTFEAVDLSKHTLNPGQFEVLKDCGTFVTELREMVPLIEEIAAEKEKNRILQGKVDGLQTDVGHLKDEVEYWKHLARKKAVERREEEGRGIGLGGLIQTWFPYGLLFIIGYLLSPLIPPLAGYHPAILGFAVTVVGLFIIKVVLKR